LPVSYDRFLIYLGQRVIAVPHRLIKAHRLLRNSTSIIVVGLALVAASVVAVGLLVVRSSEADFWLAHTVKVQQAGEALLSEIQLAEGAKRGYLLTRDSDYLNEFNQSSGAIPRLLEELSDLVADNSDQSLRLETLGPLVDAKLAEMDHTLELNQRGERTEALKTIKSAHAEGLSKSIREELFVFLNAERELLNMRQEEASALRRWLAALIGVALLTAMALATLLAIATRHAVSDLIARTRELEEESLRRQEAEDSLRQVQKMEAVGQLSGGIAHDFNNLLTIIMGNLDTAKRKLAGAEEDKKDGASSLAAKLEKPIDAAIHGAQGAARLTQRLLAFSRRQALDPAPVDMNRLVSGMLDMLRRSIGENISIETVLGPGLWPTFADAHQLENALLNLALNARAAMPEGGCLTIETLNTYMDDAYARRFGDVQPGQYVVLCLTDTGTGIPANIIDHVFEPFFSTKTAGEGSGLGLSMVHGFVKQSGGHVRIYSEEDDGTTVKIYLPRMTSAQERTAVPAAKEDTTPVPRAEPKETILLVEDNPGVRDYAKGVLQSLGYRVIEAVSAEEALDLIGDDAEIDLMFTDVVLPGATGRDLAEAMRLKYPSLPVLYTTGYTRNAIVHQGRLDADVQLLNKPYTEQDLARKVREMLDQA